MLRWQRPLVTITRSWTKYTPSLLNAHQYTFSGVSTKDLNHPHLGGKSPGEDPNANPDTMDNPYLWDPHFMPCEESDFERHHGALEEHEKDRYAIQEWDRVKGTLSRDDVMERIGMILRSMDRANTENRILAGHTHLYNDLGLDSLDQVEFGLALESEFQIQIEDEEAEQIVTVGDAADLICEHPTAA
eukprot:109588_1